MSDTKKTLLLGMGNSILTDDAIGLIVAKKVHEKIGYSALHLELSESGGMMLIEMMKGYHKLVVIDSIKTGFHDPGDVVEIDLETSTLGSHRLISVHDVSLLHAIEMGKHLKLEMPEQIKIYGIEIANNTDFSEKLSPALQPLLESITRQIVVDLLNFL